MKKPIVVVGAGAAGIIASWSAARLGAKVILLEKTDRLGTKILISGGGKCNITHDGAIESVLKAFRPNEAVFIRPSCYRFTNQMIVEMLTSRGLRVYTRDDGRIFPVDQTAKDVVSILREYLEEVGVEVQYDSPVSDISKIGDCFAIETPSGRLMARQVIVATGGSSYPKSGTTGDGWPWMKALGHTIMPVRAALAPIDLYLEDPGERAGVALRGIILKARQNGKEIARWTGDLLFSHRGITGPTALGISRVVAESFQRIPTHLEVDLLPQTNFDRLNAQLHDWKDRRDARPIVRVIEEFVPNSLAPSIAVDGKLSPLAKAQETSKKELNRLTETIKAWPLGLVKHVPLEKGECVAGGVSLEEVDPHTMESSKCAGLFLCGEVLDIAGPVGGYNLQSAFATGYVAGEQAAKIWLT